MLTQGKTTNPTLKYLDRQILFRKVRLLLFYIPTIALTLLFLSENAYALKSTFGWNSPADRVLRHDMIPPNDVLVGTLLALVLTVLNICYLAFSTTLVVQAFRRNIWLDEERMDRLWVRLAFIFVAYLFVGGWTFCSWFNIDFSMLD